jgi:D-alanyl-D-alanine carboxypeptidase (penicillin-binding protein 5/6)
VAPSHDPDLGVIGGSGLDTAGLTLPPDAPDLPTNLTARSWVVADLDTGEVLGACGPHLRSPPASVQKLLLAAVAMPQLDPKQVATVTDADLNFEPGSSAVGLLAGGKYPVSTLWLGLFLNSGNDAANVLARLAGGAAGVAGTVAAMNAEAHRLGAWDTHAATPSGLDGPAQVTSAYDLALIAKEDFDRQDFLSYISAKTAQIPAQPPRDKHGFQIQNDDQLLYQYPGAMGGKTGFTDLARHTFVGVAQRDGRRLVVAILGAEAHPAKGWQQGAALLDWGFQVPPGTSVGRLVLPGELDRPRSPTPSPSAPVAAATKASTSTHAWLLPAAMIGGVALVLAYLAIVLTGRRRDAERLSE